MGLYHEMGNVSTLTNIIGIFLSFFIQWKYRQAAIWRIMAAEGVFGPKVATDTVYNCLINNKGK